MQVALLLFLPFRLTIWRFVMVYSLCIYTGNQIVSNFSIKSGNHLVVTFVLFICSIRNLIILKEEFVQLQVLCTHNTYNQC